MRPLFPRPKSRAEAPPQVGPDDPPASAERACCCPARPAVTVMIPATSDRAHPVDLLLCGHHYRASRRALESVHALVYETPGVPALSLRTPGGAP